MRRIYPGIIMATVILLTNTLFGALSGTLAAAAGTGSVLQALGVIMSTVYLIVFIAAAVWFGYKKWTSCFVALGAIFAFSGVVGMMGYMGYSSLLGIARPLYFALISPFEPLIEPLALSWNMYYAADRIMLIIPCAAFFSSMVFYIAGTVLRANRRALQYSLMRIDARYEYRLRGAINN